MSKIPESVARLAVIGGCAVLLAAVATTVPQDGATAQPAGDIRSLRGETDIPDNNMVPDLQRQEIQAGSFERAYRQQPPLIPHSIEGDQITREMNPCVQCHDWPFNVDQGAPKISETHYLNREGVAHDRVSSNRWFCTQCHVPQSNAKALVDNDFKSALDVE